jgi:putative alpha-1,2-mannosidase
MSSSFSLFNDKTGFMEARNADGSWAGEDEGWTEGDKWAYTFNVVQDIPGLIERKGGKEQFVRFLDEHFDGGKLKSPLHIGGLTHSFDHKGHNDHTNEVRNTESLIYIRHCR